MYISGENVFKGPYEFQIPPSVRMFEVVAPFGIGWRMSAEYDDRFDDGVDGPENGAQVFVTDEEKDEENGIPFVCVRWLGRSAPRPCMF